MEKLNFDFALTSGVGNVIKSIETSTGLKIVYQWSPLSQTQTAHVSLFSEDGEAGGYVVQKSITGPNIKEKIFIY